MLKDFTPNNQHDRILLEIHDLLASINEKLDKTKEETKKKKRRGDTDV